MLLRNPRTRQPRIVTPDMSESTGALTSMPTPLTEGLLTSASRQSSVTFDAVISKPAVYVHDGSRTLSTVTVTRTFACEHGMRTGPGLGWCPWGDGHTCRHAAVASTRS